MDSHYDETSALNSLMVMESAMKVSKGASAILLADAKDRAFVAIETTKPVGLKVCEPTGANGGYEEVLYRLQGVIVGKDFPPILKNSATERARPYLRQSIKITGLGSDCFEAAMAVTYSMAALFSLEHDAESEAQAWQLPNFKEHLAFECSNRYFSSCTINGTMQKIPFDKFIDPNGTLALLENEKYIHTEENQVDYFKRVRTGQETFRFERTSPSIFRLGDIVEITVSFAAFGRTKAQPRMTAILRAVVLLDQSDREKAVMARMNNRPTIKSTVTITKRKITYEESEEDVTPTTKKSHLDVYMEGVATQETTETESKMQGLSLSGS